MKSEFPDPQIFNRQLAFSVLMGLTSYFLAFTAISAKQGNLRMTFLGSLGTWLGYMFSHFSTEGKFIDGNEEEDKDSKMLPREKKAVTGSIIGTSIAIGGMIIGFLGLQRGSLTITFGAAVVFLSGYVIAHYAATGELL